MFLGIWSIAFFYYVHILFHYIDGWLRALMIFEVLCYKCFLAHLTPDNFRSEWWTPGQRQVPAGSVPCSLGWREWPWQRAHCRWKGKDVNTTFRKSRTTFRKMGRLIHCLNTFVDFYWILIIEIYSRVNFVYHLWECTSIFRPLF